MKIALDASVLVKGLDNSEEDHDKARELFDSILRKEILTTWSVWSFLEIQRALVKKSFQDPDEARLEIEELARLGDVELIEVNEVIRNFALRFIKDLGLYAADSVHLATAVVSGCNILISEDKHLNKKKVKDHASKFDIEIIRLREFKPGSGNKHE